MLHLLYTASDKRCYLDGQELLPDNLYLFYGLNPGANSGVHLTFPISFNVLSIVFNLLIRWFIRWLLSKLIIIKKRRSAANVQFGKVFIF